MNFNKNNRYSYFILFCLFVFLCSLTIISVNSIGEKTNFAETSKIEITENPTVTETTEKHTETEPTVIEITEEPTITEPTEIETTVIETTEEPTVTEPSTETIEETTVTEPSTEINPNDLEMLACVIYQEAGADYICDNCRKYVGDIVLNRVNSENFPNTIYEVLTAPGQYGNYSKTGVIWPARASYESERHAVERAYRIAAELLSGNHSELYGNGYIWQAGFVQGTDGFWCCGIYFAR